MKLLITQRESTDAYGEDIDVLEAAYVRYFAELRIQVQPISNFLPDQGKSLIDEAFDGLVLTGGGYVSPEYYRQPHAHRRQPHRDQTEKTLIRLCRERARPILAICRGMQYLNGLYGGGYPP